VKKSIAAGIVAAQPSLLSGILKAQGGATGTGTTDQWMGTDTGETTDFAGTVADWDTYQTTLISTFRVKGEQIDLNTGLPTVVEPSTSTPDFWTKAKIVITQPNPARSVAISVRAAGGARQTGSPEELGIPAEITGTVDNLGTFTASANCSAGLTSKGRYSSYISNAIKN
jgi:hypothetical protein